MTLAITNFCKDNEWFGTFQVTGYTSLKIKPPGYDDPVLFHANQFVHGGEWYDWAMVYFYENDRDDDESTCPCKILGYFEYATPGTPTPYLVDDMSYSPGHVFDTQMRDETLYAVVHSADD